MDDFNTYEYATEQKSEGGWFAFKILLLSAYILFATGYFVTVYIIRMIPLVAVLPIFIWMLVFFTWRYTTPDYSYVIASGTLTFYVSYSKKGKKSKKTEFKISTASAIAPRDTLAKEIEIFSPQHVYSAVPGVNSADIYTALYTDKNGKNCAFHFVATAQALKLLHLYNSKTEMTKTVY